MRCSRTDYVFWRRPTPVPQASVLLDLWNNLITFGPVMVAGVTLVDLYSSALRCTIFLPIAKTKNCLNTIIGRYSYIGNPCTTDPCLPSMAYAVLANTKYYYITIDNRWFSENRSWGGYTPEPGDLVRISGYLGQKKDIFGNPFHTIEVVSLQPQNENLRA